MSSKRIVFISPTLCQPRHHRRATLLKSMFDETVAICFERGHYRENTWPSGVRQVLLPKVNDIDYIGRCKSFPDAYAKAKREIRGFKGSQVLYALSIDSCILACLLRRKGDLVVWEVGDLITPEVTQSWKKALIIRLEKSILKRSDYLVMTSQSMYDEYYAKLDPSSMKSSEQVLGQQRSLHLNLCGLHGRGIYGTKTYTVEYLRQLKLMLVNESS